MISSPPKLRDELEVIRGMDDIPLIFDPVTGNYHRITRAGEVVLTYLDGTRTREDLVALLSRADEARAEALSRQIDTFLAALDKSGLLEGSAPPDKPQDTGRVRTSMLMPRIVLTRSLPRLLEPVAVVLRAVPAKLLVLITSLLALVGYSFGFHTLFTAMPPAKDIAGPAFLIATGVMLLCVFLHETAHALVAQILGTPVRGLGVALLFYFMPVAYVDRTDAYRFRGRAGRVVLAMAGILSDGVFCGLSGVVALNSDGLLRDTAALLLGMQLLMLIVNLNPLMPSDGYTAIEAATGLTNARGRAFSLLRHAVRRQELPAHLAHLSTAARRGHMTYGVFSVVYVCLLAYAMFHAVPVTVDLSLSAVGR
ncbi:PqqD family peptide modification chaperone [Streptomyces sp. NPDC005963]|uniref:PqqD family peptide modification chaperone n=1 Tax=Streptomyces sp. NPDC005963 TaxID=3156721 RepID=UPI0033E0B08F